MFLGHFNTLRLPSLTIATLIYVSIGSRNARSQFAIHLDEFESNSSMSAKFQACSFNIAGFREM